MRNVVVLLIALGACGPAARSGSNGDDADANGGQDSNPGTGGDGNVDNLVTYVFAHTASTLYRVDPDTLSITMVGDFAWSSGSDSMTDIAIDKTGRMIGISATAVYRVDDSTAVATKLSGGLTGLFNGLSFVPADMLGQTGDDILVGTRNADGAVFRIDPMTGHTTSIGDMMGGFTSSGDLVAVQGFGTAQTADNGFSADRLVRLAPQTFTATPVGSDIGFAEIWGIAYWKTKIFGFTNAGEFVTIDPTTGVGTLVASNGPAWWGAAVSTLAPVIF